jgi:uncharacterized protein YlxW (UPF0749 family)
MNKQKIIMAIIIGLICFILVYVMFLQFRVVEQTDLTEIENMQEKELREALASWKSKYEEANEELEATISKTEEYESKINSNEESTELLEQELEQANILLGKTDVKGEGVVITLENNEVADIVADDLIYLVNELRDAGAEAISINDQRITNMTDIVEISDKYIRINSNIITAPYTVKAIGNKTYLQSALSLKNVGFIDEYTAYNKTVKLEAKNNIIIYKYEANEKADKMVLKYIQ